MSAQWSTHCPLNLMVQGSNPLKGNQKKLFENFIFNQKSSIKQRSHAFLVVEIDETGIGNQKGKSFFFSFLQIWSPCLCLATGHFSVHNSLIS